MHHADFWMAPMVKEYQTLLDKGVWDLVDLPDGERCIDAMWVYDLKLDGAGNIVKPKARLVARGDSMIAGVDFDSSWAMVARMESVRVVMSVAAVLHLTLKQWDFSAAYLNGVLDRPMYMRQPKGFVKGGMEGKVCLLKRPLYGMVQAGHIWYKMLEKGYEELGFHASKADPCVRTRIDGDKYTVTTTHTDDVLSASSSKEEALRVMKEFADKWDLKDVDELQLLLGLTVERFDNGDVGITQTAYFEKVLRHFGFWDLSPLSTPLPPHTQVHANAAPLSEADIAFMKDKPFRPVLGTLIWGSSGTRPDISFACGALGHIQSRPNPEHWRLLVGVCRYVRGTLDYGILYRSLDVDGPGKGLKPLGYVDADWAGCIDSRRSTSGYIFLMGGAPVSWSSKRQAVVALSSTEAEYISLARGSQQAMWMKNFLSEINLAQPPPFLLNGDNLGSLSLTETTKGHGLSKHIDIRYHYIRDRVKEGDIAVRAVRTTENVADILTKALPRVAHERFVREMGLDWKRRDTRGSVKD